MPTLLIAVVFTLIASLAQADTSRTSETKDMKTYGNCITFTERDLFTDEEYYTVTCGEETLTDATAIGIRSQRDGLYVILSKGLQFHLEDQVPVIIRVDKGPVIRRSADWDRQNPRRAFIQDDHLARRLLDNLANGQRAILKVGDEGGNIQLDGSQRAVADFRHRASLQPQQTLEIPARAC
ncbi:MAG: hypothetical protein OXC18_06855 [Desulfurellaceae bacterium]|nr:hypothetical protein [Desulfurellaceae bacterium]